jgi:hypothetical protein
METEKIYQLADEMTEQQITEILSDWKSKNENEKIKTFNSLVRLGDSIQLACATVILNKPIDKEVFESYRFAYEN